jgi:hypothetical protein
MGGAFISCRSRSVLGDFMFHTSIPFQYSMKLPKMQEREPKNSNPVRGIENAIGFLCRVHNIRGGVYEITGDCS